jgi:hypothetical protein
MSFAKPMAKPPKARPAPLRSQRFRSSRSMSSRPRTRRSMAQHLTMLMSPSTVRESIADPDGIRSRHVSRAGTAISTPSSTVFHISQQSPAPPPTPRLPRALPFPSKFSFSTPLSNSPSISVWGGSQRRSYTSKMSDNDAGTICTTDSEPVQFRTVSVWVSHQQTRAMRRQQLRRQRDRGTLLEDDR